MVWELKDITKKSLFDFRYFSEVLSPTLLHAFKLALTDYAQRCSFSHMRNCFYRSKHFFSIIAHTSAASTQIHTIRVVDILNFKGGLGNQHEWYLGVLSGFFVKWHELGYPGIEPAVPILLRELRLTGNRKGEAVLTVDPEGGPFTDIEIQAIVAGVTKAFDQKEISWRGLALIWLFIALGSRPVNLAALKLCDLKIAEAADGSRSHVLEVPRAKMRGGHSRGDFKPRSLIQEVGTVIEAQVKKVQEEAREHLFPLPDDLSNLPLFPSWHSSGLPGFEHHTDATCLGLELKSVLEKIAVVSERTGRPLAITSRRFRYTRGTRAAEEGCTPLVIADLLDHTDTQQVWVYTQTTPEIIERMDKALAMQLFPLAHAFAGIIVTDETAAERGDDPSSRVFDPRYGSSPGTCGKHGSCNAPGAIACYTCVNFQAWLDGPHEQILDHLIAEQERQMVLTGDERIAHVHDRTILAIAEVVRQCHAIKEELQSEE